jgi:hypothetical protein
LAFGGLCGPCLAPVCSGHIKGWKNQQEEACGGVPASRSMVLCLILFVCRFAKLNSAFFDTTVSCSTYYFDETARSWGFSIPPTVGVGGMAQLLPFFTAITELSVPILLLVKCTRIIGVVLGLVFHSLIALDRLHLFVDFSSVLAAMFILFLPARFATSALDFLKGRGRQLLIIWAIIA